MPLAKTVGGLDPSKNVSNIEKITFKKIFKEDHTSYTKDGAELILELDNEISKIYNKYIDKGYSPRDINNCLIDSSFNISTKRSIPLGEKIDDILKKRSNRNLD